MLDEFLIAFRISICVASFLEKRHRVAIVCSSNSLGARGLDLKAPRGTVVLRLQVSACLVSMAIFSQPLNDRSLLLLARWTVYHALCQR